MAARLDVTAAINLIGEEKLREEIDKNTYLFLHLRYEEIENDGFTLPIVKISKLKRFKTESNPIGYLLTDEFSFFLEIGVTLSDKIYKRAGFTTEDKCCDFILDSIDENEFNSGKFNDITLNIIELLWDVIGKELSHDEIIMIFKNMNNGSDEMFHIFDKDQKEILLGSDKIFLDKWFPR